jgi:phosphotransferase system enzyme I (PtsI)
VTADGVRITLEANLEIADEVHRVLDSGAEGIGLYRSEFLLDAGDAAATTGEAQYQTYRTLIEAMRPKPVTIRTFDADEDRGARAGGHRDRFGLRGIRTALQHDERFLTQIRALLRRRARPVAHSAAVRDLRRGTAADSGRHRRASRPSRAAVRRCRRSAR